MPDKRYTHVTRREMVDRLDSAAGLMESARNNALAACAIAANAGDEIRATWLYDGVQAELLTRLIQLRANAESIKTDGAIAPADES